MKRWSDRPVTRTAGALVITGVAMSFAAATPPAQAMFIDTQASNVSFETLGQSMWGPNGPSVVDTGVLFIGPEWNNATATGNATLQFGKTISLTSISKTIRDLAGLPSSVTIGSTSETDVDLSGRTSGKIGLDFRAIFDPGSVDAFFDGRAATTITEQAPDPLGYRSFVVDTRQVLAEATLVTRSPQIDIESNFVTQMEAFIGIDGKVITQAEFGKVPAGCPYKIGVFTVPCVFNGQSEKSFNIDTEVQVIDLDDKEELLKVTNDVVRVAGLELFGPDEDSGQIEIEFDISVDVAELISGTGNPVDVTVGPAGERKQKDVDPTDVIDASFSIGDITLSVPLLNTQATEQLNGVKEVTTSGTTNLARLDVDADAMATIFFGLPPLGATLGAGGFSISPDLVDADLGVQTLAGQDFSFEPTLMQRTTFSEEVYVRVAGGAWEMASEVITTVGESFEFQTNPFSNVTVDTTYFLNNQLTNLTTLLGQPVFEMAILQLAFGTPFPVPTPSSIAAATFLEPLSDPFKIATLFDETFALNGFDENGGDQFDIAASLNGVAELTTGSPVSLIQEFANPGVVFDLFFDTRFVDALGILEVFIDSVLVGTFDAAAPESDFMTQQISGLSFLDSLLTLEFRYDAPTSGSVLLIDNVRLSIGTILNGDFQTGNLDGWTGDGPGSLAFAALQVPVPEPTTLVLLSLGVTGLGAFAWHRRRQRANA